MADGQHGSSGHTWIFPELLEGEGGSEGNFSGLGLKAGAFWHKRPGVYPLVDCYWQNWLLCAIMMATWHLLRSDMLSLERGWRMEIGTPPVFAKNDQMLNCGCQRGRWSPPRDFPM